MPTFSDLSSLGKQAGIAQGLSAGVDAFINTRSKLNEEALKKQLANTQGIEAFSKLAPVVGRDKALGLMQNAGLVSPSFSFQPSQDSSMAQPGQQPTQAPSSSGSPNTLAPNAPKLDSATTPQGSPDYSNMDQWDREWNMFKNKQDYEKSQPAAQAALRNTQNEPTKNAISAFDKPSQHISTVVSTHGNLKQLLQSGDPKSSELIFSLLGRLSNPDSPRPNNELANEVKEDPQFKAVVRDYLSEAKTGVISLKTRQEIGTIADHLTKSELASHANLAKDAENKWTPMGATPGFTKLDNTLNQAKQNMGPVRGLINQGATQSQPTGLLGGGNTNAAPAGGAKNPPPGLNFQQFKAWKRQNGG